MQATTPPAPARQEAPLPVGACCHDDEAPGLGVSSETWAKTWLKVAIALVIAGQGTIFSLGFNTADPRPEFGSTVYWLLNGALALSATIVIGLLGVPLIREMLRGLRQGKLTVEALFVITALGAFAGSLVSTFTGTGSLYYEVVAIVLAIYTIGKTLGARSRAKALEAAERLRTDFDAAWVESCCAEGRKRVPLAKLQPGQEVIVAPGEPITVDGQVVRGEGFVQETAINGETEPVRRGEGESVFAGSYAVDASLVIRAEGLAGSRKLDAIFETIEAARLRPSALQAQADRLTRWFVPIVISVSVATFIYWSVVGAWQVALFNAMAVLLVACPCALGLATPIAVWSGLMNLSRLGLVCGAGDFLDTLATAKWLIFDKTGTLSGERLSLSRVDVMPGADEPALRAMIRAAETPIQHPVAEPLKSLETDEALLANCRVEATKLVPGKGLQARVALGAGPEQELRIGALDYMPEAERAAFSALGTEEAKRRLYVTCEGRAVAVISLEEKLRADTESTMQELRGLGCELAILTGDEAPRWRELAGVSICAGMHPEAKVAAVQEREGRGEAVVFIGDGINDAAAMAVSSGGIAMGAGADLTRSSAAAILVGNTLSCLPEAVRVCRRIRRAVRSNLLFALSYNVLGMGLAAAGILHPVVAAVLMLGSSSLVSWRAARSARLESVQNGA